MTMKTPDQFDFSSDSYSVSTLKNHLKVFFIHNFEYKQMKHDLVS